METIIVGIVILSLLAYLFFDKRKNDENARMEKLELIRELTTALMSKNTAEYTTSLPVYDTKSEKEVVQDEIVDIDQVDPEDLLNAIKE